MDCADSEGLAAFWGTALGYKPRPLWWPYAGAKDPAARDPYVTFQHAADGPVNKLHFDLYSDDPDADAARLVELGASRVQRVAEGDTWWWVLRDPAGNEFCVVATLGADRAM